MDNSRKKKWKKYTVQLRVGLEPVVGRLGGVLSRAREEVVDRDSAAAGLGADRIPEHGEVTGEGWLWW